MLNQRWQRFPLETEVSAKFNQVKPRLDKFNQKNKAKLTEKNQE